MNLKKSFKSIWFLITIFIILEIIVFITAINTEICKDPLHCSKISLSDSLYFTLIGAIPSFVIASLIYVLVGLAYFLIEKYKKKKTK